VIAKLSDENRHITANASTCSAETVHKVSARRHTHRVAQLRHGGNLTSLTHFNRLTTTYTTTRSTGCSPAPPRRDDGELYHTPTGKYLTSTARRHGELFDDSLDRLITKATPEER